MNRVSGTYGRITKENICIIRLPKGEERDSGTEILFQGIMAKNDPNLEKETNLQVQEAEQVSNKINPKKSIP